MAGGSLAERDHRCVALVVDAVRATQSWRRSITPTLAGSVALQWPKPQHHRQPSSTPLHCIALTCRVPGSCMTSANSRATAAGGWPKEPQPEHSHSSTTARQCLTLRLVRRSVSHFSAAAGATSVLHGNTQTTPQTTTAAKNKEIKIKIKNIASIRADSLRFSAEPHREHSN